MERVSGRGRQSVKFDGNPECDLSSPSNPPAGCTIRLKDYNHPQAPQRQRENERRRARASAREKEK